jgi:hypothetical protein
MLTGYMFRNKIEIDDTTDFLLSVILFSIFAVFVGFFLLQGYSVVSKMRRKTKEEIAKERAEARAARLAQYEGSELDSADDASDNGFDGLNVNVNYGRHAKAMKAHKFSVALKETTPEGLDVLELVPWHEEDEVIHLTVTVANSTDAYNELMDKIYGRRNAAVQPKSTAPFQDDTAGDVEMMKISGGAPLPMDMSTGENMSTGDNILGIDEGEEINTASEVKDEGIVIEQEPVENDPPSEPEDVPPAAPDAGADTVQVNKPEQSRNRFQSATVRNIHQNRHRKQVSYYKGRVITKEGEPVEHCIVALVMHNKIISQRVLGVSGNFIFEIGAGHRSFEIRILRAPAHLAVDHEDETSDEYTDNSDDEDFLANEALNQMKDEFATQQLLKSLNPQVPAGGIAGPPATDDFIGGMGMEPSGDEFAEPPSDNGYADPPSDSGFPAMDPPSQSYA